MGIQCEKPIKNKSEDKLKRNRFAINLAENIKHYNYDESITIGLMGEWGTGKSSIINMVKDELQQSNLIIVEFNPWYFAGRKQLIADFFKVLSEVLGNNDKSVSKLSKDLKLYAAALKPITLIPQIGPIISVLSKASELSGQFFDEYSKSQNEDISKIKERINEHIMEYNKKILIIIDEIDRLENEDIKEIFQLVRALGDFDNMIYLLSFDKEKVSKVFSSGEDYLEKIINVPLYIPDISSKSINDYFREELDEIFKEKKDIKIEQEYWEEMFECVFKDKFYNLREVNRFLNIIRFNLENIIKDLNPIDYIVISFLKMFDEKIVDFIKHNKKKLLDKQNKQKIHDEIKSKNIISNKNINVLSLIDLLFYSYRHKSFRSISNYKIFDSYFEYALPDDVYTIDELASFKAINSIDDFKIKIQDLNENELLKVFYNLDDICDNISENQIYIIHSVLIKKISLFEKRKSNSFIKSKQRDAFESLIKSLSKLNNNHILKIISELDFNCDYEIESFLEYLISVVKQFNTNKLNNLIIEKLKVYINDIKDKTLVIRNIKKLKQIGFNVKEYIENLIQYEDGLILYLDTISEEVDMHQEPIYDGDGNIIDVEIYKEKIIIKEAISNYINYNYVNDRVEAISEKSRKENKKLISAFKQAKSYKETYEHFIENGEMPEECEY